MRTKIIHIALFCLCLGSSTNIKADQTLTNLVYTPNHSSITAMIITEVPPNYYLRSEYELMQDFQQTYPAATIIGNRSYKYNCHSFAFKEVYWDIQYNENT